MAILIFLKKILNNSLLLCNYGERKEMFISYFQRIWLIFESKSKKKLTFQNTLTRYKINISTQSKMEFDQSIKFRIFIELASKRVF